MLGRGPGESCVHRNGFRDKPDNDKTELYDEQNNDKIDIKLLDARATGNS